MTHSTRDTNSRHTRSSRMARYGALALGAVALAALSACSSDDSIHPEPDAPSTQTSADAITYHVTGEGSTRAGGSRKAAHLYNSNNIPSQFYVSAWALDADESTDDIGHTYISSDLIKNTGSTGAQNWVDQVALRYWPNNGEVLNFFATNATNGALVYDDENKSGVTPISNPKYEIQTTINPSAAQQQDLLYTAVYGQKKTVTGAAGQTTQAVNLDFHHALSQVVFTAQCTNTHLDVQIGNISIVGVAGTGTLTMPADRASSTPSWTIATDYTPGAFSSDVDGTQGAVKVGAIATNITAGSNQSEYALMMIPQKVAAADPTASDAWTGQKAYLKVDCVIYNVGVGGEDGKAQTTIDTMIFGKPTDVGGYAGGVGYATLYIPVSVDWEMGKRYVYNLQFGAGNGGYNEDGTAALVPIKYQITADDWTEAGSTNIQEPGTK